MEPGERPSMWWFAEAPAPRRQVGGIGVPAWIEQPAIMPEYALGIPASWAWIDPRDPPAYESQAAYLRRHGLLAPSESRRLRAADFDAVELVSLEDIEVAVAGAIN